MLSDDAIENLVQPIIDRQESINAFVLELIAKRVREVGGFSPSDINRLKLLVQMGNDIRLINEELAKLTNLQVRDIKSLIKQVAIEDYIDAKPFYDYRHKSFIPYNDNKELQQLVSAIANQTADTYVNISNSSATGFIIRDPQTPNVMRFQSIEGTYQSVIDEAVQAVRSKTVDFNTAVRRTIRQLADSGVRRIVWDSGYTQRLDSAVRRNVLDGVHAVRQQVQDEIGRQIGANGKELSAHANSALDHEPIQGHIFTNEEYDKLQNESSFKDVKGTVFGAIRRAIGMWNCGHWAKSIIIESYKPRYTDAQLKKFIDDNHAGYTTSTGRHFTMYECKQYQRQLETKIRYAKEHQIAFRASGDRKQAELYQSKINDLLTQYKMFSNACGLKPQMARTRVPDYHRIKIV